MIERVQDVLPIKYLVSLPLAAFLLNKQLGKLHLPLRLYFGQNLNIENTSAVSSTASSMKMIKMLKEVPGKKVRLKAKVQVRPTGPMFTEVELESAPNQVRELHFSYRH